jgi:hypothetical protein
LNAFVFCFHIVPAGNAANRKGEAAFGISHACWIVFLAADYLVVPEGPGGQATSRNDLLLAEYSLVAISISFLSRMDGVELSDMFLPLHRADNRGRSEG